MQYNNFGKFLRKKRKAAEPSISLNRFAFENDIDSAALSRIENQKQGISLEVLSKIANGYKTTVSKLIEEFEIYTENNEC